MGHTTIKSEAVHYLLLNEVIMTPVGIQAILSRIPE